MMRASTAAWEELWAAAAWVLTTAQLEAVGGSSAVAAIRMTWKAQQWCRLLPLQQQGCLKEGMRRQAFPGAFPPAGVAVPPTEAQRVR